MVGARRYTLGGSNAAESLRQVPGVTRCHRQQSINLSCEHFHGTSLLEVFRLVQVINYFTLDEMSQKMMHWGTKNAL